MFLLPRLQQNYDAKDGHYSTLNSTRKDTHAGVYSGSQGITGAKTLKMYRVKDIMSALFNIISASRVLQNQLDHNLKLQIATTELKFLK